MLLIFATFEFVAGAGAKWVREFENRSVIEVFPHLKPRSSYNKNLYTCVPFPYASNPVIGDVQTERNKILDKGRNWNGYWH